MIQQFLTTKECTEILRITKPTLLKLVREGKLKAIRIGHNYRILKDDFDSFVKVGTR